MTRPVKDTAASVRHKLANYARQSQRPFQEVLEYFAMERFLRRLAASPHKDRFILKGALMFTAWRASATRPTRDIDFLGRMDNQIDTITAAIREVCLASVEPDGLVFDAESVAGKLIKEDADYHGVRVIFRGKLQNARIPMQIDIGFGDVVTPKPQRTEYPSLLDYDPPVIFGYSRETVVAEKFDAMTKLGLLNSRMKDFFDLWLLAGQFPFDGMQVARAIRETFANRKTPIEENPIALSEPFARDANKQKQWHAFLRKSRIDNAPADFAEVIAVLRQFLSPISEAIRGNVPFRVKWNPPGPWTA